MGQGQFSAAVRRGEEFYSSMYKCRIDNLMRIEDFIGEGGNHLVWIARKKLNNEEH
jgi:hypothetical protein